MREEEKPPRERPYRERSQEEKPHKKTLLREKSKEKKPQRERPHKERSQEEEPCRERHKQRYKEEETCRERRERIYEEEYHEERRGKRYDELPRRHHKHVNDCRRAPMDDFKCWIPPFAREADVETFLDWDMKVDQVLECFNYNDCEKVKMDQFSKEIREDQRRHVDTLLDLMRKIRWSRFVPTSYAWNLYNKL
ncbi:hypothetical protein CR513_24868, partial [Mucuna pruriens]